MNITDLKIDMEFASKIPPLTGEELMRLHESILTEGRCISPIVAWDGVIVDGHNRYRFLSHHPEIEYEIYEKDFLDRNDVIAWICKNQLGRRNLTPEQKKYLIGKQYEAEKQALGGEREMARDENGLFTAMYQNDTHGKKENTGERIAEKTMSAVFPSSVPKNMPMPLTLPKKPCRGSKMKFCRGQSMPRIRKL